MVHPKVNLSNSNCTPHYCITLSIPITITNLIILIFLSTIFITVTEIYGTLYYNLLLILYVFISYLILHSKKYP